MAIVPELFTERLRLRQLELADAPAIQALISEKEVSENLLVVPHPYPPNGAVEFISADRASDELRWGIERVCDGAVMGVVGLTLHLNQKGGELGYWFGIPYWGQGYGPEAVGAVMDYAFRSWDLERVFAAVFSWNDRSARMLEKIGMTYEGTLRKQYFVRGEMVDGRMYSMIRPEWEAQ